MEYKKPQMEVFEFKVEDVITASLGDVGNTNNGDPDWLPSLWD